jgi:hypothetical protein
VFGDAGVAGHGRGLASKAAEDYGPAAGHAKRQRMGAATQERVG